MYDVIVVGGSFAGLAAALQLRGYHTLLIDQWSIGTHQTSTCAMPLSSARLVGAECAAQMVHSTLVIHTWGREITYALPDPYITFDYSVFCQAILAQTDAEVWLARATGYSGGIVKTTRGDANAPFVVDASGWRSLQPGGPSREIPGIGYGMETELPVSAPVGPGLHFYFENGIVRNGYAWVFPCGATTRIGVCAFDKGVHLRPVLDTFLERFGLRCGPTHGGGHAYSAARTPVRRPVRRGGRGGAVSADMGRGDSVVYLLRYRLRAVYCRCPQRHYLRR